MREYVDVKICLQKEREIYLEQGKGILTEIWVSQCKYSWAIFLAFYNIQRKNPMLWLMLPI